METIAIGGVIRLLQVRKTKLSANTTEATACCCTYWDLVLTRGDLHAVVL